MVQEGSSPFRFERNNYDRIVIMPTILNSYGVYTAFNTMIISKCIQDIKLSWSQFHFFSFEKDFPLLCPYLHITKRHFFPVYDGDTLYFMVFHQYCLDFFYNLFFRVGKGYDYPFPKLPPSLFSKMIDFFPMLKSYISIGKVSIPHNFWLLLQAVSSHPPAVFWDRLCSF